jgi:acyl-CoA reductase-like NAD-dependent aldehyde dehydrogenase
VPEMGVEETRAAIDAAAAAFKTWSRTTAKERHDILMKMYYLMQDNADDLARIIVCPRAARARTLLNSAVDVGKRQGAGGGQGICARSWLLGVLTGW